ncbi:MAG: hypothetical protein JOZ96_23240 [Acidobacteria bacterium]|nr:hypothetical protein [Acidobacteriota bacterium]
MTKPRLKLTALAASLLFALVLCAAAAAQEKGAAVFKAPGGWMPADKTEIGPIVFLNPEKPSVMFVTYPKQDETTTEGQRQRLRKLAAGMFFHDDKAALDWQVKSVPSHPGDGDGKADIATARQGDMEVQIVTYERTTGPRPFIYGYIAMRNKKSGAPFVDENGKGVKDFDKLWKSLPN